ncbi:cation/H(+) antiporter [Myxococcus llanfairpwllgwyngyllgogerychwyrndrobwllllantysiliogogogochensis]|uniref:Cation/H(+) antiporter n=1 Tax=Myxococcus llanfairpwllgwyngyllgogerychwyrndrobwllllantysiliogogogochensis TaxID=2590453 RepID=A0A540X4W3_9BACT|nr:cation:proton antiporter [Myxococcus llanfairpwllgwyngyllgogerychwyrndrobwllllantysiliogogogochensis]TQF16295.1 cation/H(+) antiporter [Myxococcus llanfairpwllgwyngyllgogerychwyrndrobwllllantysiliogogogochensis]
MHTNALTLLMMQLIVIIGVSRLIGRGTRWLGQPLVIAEVVAGIVLGPSLLGWLAPDLMNTLFPTDSLPILKMLSQVGLVLFMFLIGLELDPKLLKGRGHASVAISHTSIIVPFALGAVAAALWLYKDFSDPSVPFSSFVLFMGVAMSITAFPVLARILTERGLLQSRIGAIAIACAAVDDVTAWCLLAFVVSIVRASDLAQAGLTTVFAMGYIAFMLLAVRPFLARLGARVASREGLTQNVVAGTLLLLLASAWATELIGIHALFGAFLFGAVIPKEGGLAEALSEKLEDVAVVLLLPVFFAFSGLRTQIGLLNTPEAWLTCGAIILLACVGKFGGSAVAARMTGMRWREAGAIGILMNTRGLMELIVLNLGLDLGVISPTLFTMMVLMALVTTFMTTPLLQLFYPTEELARDRLELAPPATPGSTPYTVLMCVSHQQAGPGMASLAKALAGGEGAQLHALHLVHPERVSLRGAESEPRASDQDVEGDGALAPLLGRAKSLGLAVRPLSFVSTEPAQDIRRTAEAKRADLVLLGWHKPLFSQTVLGGTVHEVMQAASGTVAVLVDRGLSDVKRVLVPFIGSRHDRAALKLARRLMRQSGAEITVLHVTSRESNGARAQVDELFPAEEGSGVRLKVVQHESPEEAALEEARHGGHDLVVVGVGAPWGLEDRVFGLQRERIVRDAPGSLLVVHESEPVVEAVATSQAAASAVASRS